MDFNFNEVAESFKELEKTPVVQNILNIYQNALADVLNILNVLNVFGKSASDDFKALVIKGLEFSDFKAALMLENQQENQQENINNNIEKNIDIKLAWQTYHAFKTLWLANIYQKINIDQLYQQIKNQLNADYDYAQINQRSLAYAYLKVKTYLSLNFENFENHIEYLNQSYDQAKHLSQRLTMLQNLLLLQNLMNLITLSELKTPISLGFDTTLTKLLNNFSHEPLVVDQWFKLQALQYERNDQKAVEKIRQLMKYPEFSDNPNRARALLLTFFTQNPAFYSTAGLQLWEDIVLYYDAQNPQLAARFARSLDDWQSLDVNLKPLIAERLKTVQEKAKTGDVLEVINKAIG